MKRWVLLAAVVADAFVDGLTATPKVEAICQDDPDILCGRDCTIPNPPYLSYCGIWSSSSRACLESSNGCVSAYPSSACECGPSF